MVVGNGTLWGQLRMARSGGLGLGLSRLQWFEGVNTLSFTTWINRILGITFCSIFNIERGGGREGALGIKLTPVNVQVSQHFWPGL